MAADQVELTVAQDDVGFRELRTAGANGFCLPALERDAGLEALFDEVVMKGFAVFDDAHMRGRSMLRATTPGDSTAGL